MSNENLPHVSMNGIHDSGDDLKSVDHMHEFKEIKNTAKVKQAGIFLGVLIGAVVIFAGVFFAWMTYQANEKQKAEEMRKKAAFDKKANPKKEMTTDIQDLKERILKERRQKEIAEQQDREALQRDCNLRRSMGEKAIGPECAPFFSASNPSASTSASMPVAPGVSNGAVYAGPPPVTVGAYQQQPTYSNKPLDPMSTKLPVRLPGNLMVFGTMASSVEDDVPQSLPTSSQPMTSRPSGNPMSSARDNGGGTALEKQLQSSEFQGTQARQLDRNFLLTQGKTIPCALNTGISTDLPGLVICKTTRDVYSDTGVLLVDRGSSVIGEQQGMIKHGQSRVFVMWNRIDTPKGVTFNIKSPAADEMGYNGAPAEVHTHWWLRFGNALMVSLISDGFKYALSQKDEGGTQTNNTVVLGGTAATTQSMATEAIKQGIGILPTGYVAPGTQLNIMVSRDVDFSDVYRVIK